MKEASLSLSWLSYLSEGGVSGFKARNTIPTANEFAAGRRQGLVTYAFSRAVHKRFPDVESCWYLVKQQSEKQETKGRQ